MQEKKTKGGESGGLLGNFKLYSFEILSRFFVNNFCKKVDARPGN